MKIAPIHIIGLVLLIGGGGFFLKDKLMGSNTSAQSPAQVSTQLAGSTVKIAGSKSLANLNKKVEVAVLPQGITVISKAGGSSEGLRLLRAGRIDIAAISKRVEEPGYKATPVSRDAIAFFTKLTFSSLTAEELKNLFRDNLVLNSPVSSGTRKTVEELLEITIPVNSKAVKVDALTGSEGVINNLKDLVGYGSADQVVDQKTVNIITIDGKNPGDDGYLFSRDLYYVTKENPTPAVQAVVDAASKL